MVARLLLGDGWFVAVLMLCLHWMRLLLLASHQDSVGAC